MPLTTMYSRKGGEHETYEKRYRVAGRDDRIRDDSEEQIFTQRDREHQQKGQGDKRPRHPERTPLPKPGAPHHDPPPYWSEKRTTSWEIWSYWELTKEVQTAKVPEKLSMAIINSRPPIHR